MQEEHYMWFAFEENLLSFIEDNEILVFVLVLLALMFVANLLGLFDKDDDEEEDCPEETDQI